MALSIYANVPYIAILIAFAIAVYTDVRTRKIPNGIPLALALSALVYQANQGLFFCLTSIGVMIFVMVIGLFLFTRGWLGGGDIKLLASACGFLPLRESLDLVIFTSIGGMVLALATSAVQGTLRQTISNSVMLLHALRVDSKTRITPESTAELPYAIAIMFGGVILTLFHTFAPAVLSEGLLR